MTRAQKMFAEALIAIGVLGAIWVAVERVMVEQTDRTVGMAVDWSEVEQLAAASGVTPEDMLAALQSGGATHLAIPERSLTELVDRGDIAIFTNGEYADIVSPGTATIGQVAQALRARFPGDYERMESSEGDLWLRVPSAAVSSSLVGGGYSRHAIEAATRVGMRSVARPVTAGVRTPAAVEAVLAQAADMGAEAMIFSGDSVIGFPGLAETTAEGLRERRITFGMIEMSPQKGAAELATELDYDILRVHSITVEEMAAYPVHRAVDRFVRAARERGGRLLYLRMIPVADEGLVEANATYLAHVREGLRDLGFIVGAPEPSHQFSTPTWRLGIVMLGMIGGLAWLVQALFGLPGRWFWSLVVLAVIASAGMLMVSAGLTRSIAALAAAVIFPILAVGWAARGLTASPTARQSFVAVAGRILGAFLGVTAVTILGGLLIVGLLGDSAYLVKVAQFRGVKIAHLLPIMAVAVIWLARSTEAYREHRGAASEDMVDYHTGDTVPEWPALWAGIRQALSGLIAYWHVAAAFVGLAILAMLVIRSGNEAADAVLPMEMELRAALDRFLGVRPRTKEVLLGHPVMILALLLALRRVRPGVWILFAIGTIGQVSLLNSFCHIHSPLLLTGLRVFNGIWVGALAGLVLGIIWDTFCTSPACEAEPHPQRILDFDEDDEEL